MSAVVMTPWQVPAVRPSLSPGIIHLWRFRLDDAAVANLLNREELDRAQRLRVPEKSQAFVASRTRLRQILSSYLDVDPVSVEFLYNENGKPFLEDSFLKFNLSHSGAWGVCALTANADIGVDLEVVNHELNFESLAERFFSEKEHSWLQSIPEERRRRCFFRLWTRKEAWLKGKGGGFTELKLALDPVHLNVASTTSDGWWLMNTPVARGYVGALAMAGDAQRVERWSCRGVG